MALGKWQQWHAATIFHGELDLRETHCSKEEEILETRYQISTVYECNWCIGIGQKDKKQPGLTNETITATGRKKCYVIKKCFLLYGRGRKKCYVICIKANNQQLKLNQMALSDSLTVLKHCRVALLLSTNLVLAKSVILTGKQKYFCVQHHTEPLLSHFFLSLSAYQWILEFNYLFM